ncbi:lysozyme [Psychrobacter alimentarius]|uniref:lysozyme n=1 Tax=Psychrobacter alimentarius TaxID=261164 RepID=UPI003FD439E4
MTHTDFFNWLREQQDDNKLSQNMVNGANEMLALMDVEALKDALSKVNGWSVFNSNDGMRLSDVGSKVINQFEGFRSSPYRDTKGVWTIGFGNTYYENGTSVKPTDPAIARERALELKRNVVNKDFAPAVNIMLADEIDKGWVTQNMFDMLISLGYNIGAATLATSTVIRKIRLNDKRGAADALLLFNKVRKNGRLEVEPGLNTRRNKERQIFLS